ncbi:MAG TPA: hypothetical protein VHE36_06375 [Sphingomicrobium sp.]|nr:hypothetical protein [Sphingomicrobium sp.]
MNDVAEAEARYSADWWESRTLEELQDLARTGLASGDIGSGALREIERRAQERAIADQHQQELEVVEKQGLRIRLLVAVLIALLVGVIAVVLLR